VFARHAVTRRVMIFDAEPSTAGEWQLERSKSGVRAVHVDRDELQDRNAALFVPHHGRAPTSGASGDVPRKPRRACRGKRRYRDHAEAVRALHTLQARSARAVIPDPRLLLCRPQGLAPDPQGAPVTHQGWLH
jgi:hypothetical protein